MSDNEHDPWEGISDAIREHSEAAFKCGAWTIDCADAYHERLQRLCHAKAELEDLFSSLHGWLP